MKCLVFLVATTIVCQIAANPSIRRRRGYVNHNSNRAIIIGSEQDPFIHPTWFESPNEPKPLEPTGPFGSYEISHGGYSSSSSEEVDITRQTGPNRTPGYGGPVWWRPPGPGSSTTERSIPSIPTAPTIPNGNNILEQIASCIKSCPVTSEFNPVCGSNNVTYLNPGRLGCEQRCGSDVQLSRETACSVSLPDTAACVRNCPVTTEYNPVCGSNNVTYANHGRLLCDQLCGIPVELTKLSPCSSNDNNPEPPLTSEQQLACMKSCPVTGEYNPVCGSNNVTYTNPGRLECAQYCGVEVVLSKKSACGGSEPATTTESTFTIGGFAALCMRSCPVTSEFNPVCGSNNVTYTNPGRLECAQTCGVAVTLARPTSCEAPINAEENKKNADYEAKTTTELNLVLTTSTSTARPYVNGNGENNLNGGNNENQNNDEDKNSNSNDGNIGENFSGGGLTNVNNGNTDDNSSPIDTNKEDNNSNPGNNENEDDKGNDNNATKGRPGGIGNNGNNFHGGNGGGNSGNNFHGGNGGGNNGNNFHGGNGGNNGNYNCKEVNNRRPPSVKEIMACMQMCSLTSESNPVCGTDSVTYINPSRLLCAQFCGVDVKVKKFAPCASTSTTNVHCPNTCTNSPVTDNPVTPPIPSIDACMEACPASLEFKPVCGNNNVTYRNLEKLQCARRCGIDVSLKRSTHCSAPEDIPEPKDNATLILECIEHCYVPQKYEPICGTNNVTYNNTGHLICARQCGLDIKVKQSSPCFTVPNVTPSPPPTTSTTEKVDPGHNGFNFTIDPDVLANIWGTTSTTPKDNDEDFELDQRIQEKQ